MSDEDLADFAESALKQGAVYFCTWGPDCERVHDIFDETIIETQMKLSSEEYVPSDVMTTWHDDETLEEALEFLLVNTPLDDQAAVHCKAAIAVSVGDAGWAERIDSVMQAQIPADARTYVYSGMSSGGCWTRDDFDEPLEEFAEYM